MTHRDDETCDGLEPLAHDRVRAEIETRFELLLIHALTSFLGGMLILMYGNSLVYEQISGPYSRLVVGAVAISGGACLAVGAQKSTSWRWTAFGMGLVLIWYASMTVGFAGTIIVDHPVITAPWEHASPQSSTRPYIAVVYLGMTCFSMAHLRTILHVKGH